MELNNENVSIAKVNPDDIKSKSDNHLDKPDASSSVSDKGDSNVNSDLDSKESQSNDGSETSKSDTVDDVTDKASGNKKKNAVEEEKDDEKKDGKGKAGDKLKAKAAATVAAAATKQMLIAKFIMMMKAWLMMMLAALQAIAAAIIQAIIAIVQAIIHGIVVAVATIAAAIGVSVAVAAFGLLGVIVGVVVVGVAVVTSNSTNNNAIRDSAIVEDDCYVQVQDALDGANINADEQELAMAQSVYSVMSVYGIPNINIAGMLGNWSIESGIDPTTIETIYDENYNVNGSKHQEALADLDAFTRNTVFPAYSGSVSINQSAYQASDGKYYCGLGLGQWTGPAALTLINFASDAGYEWYDIEAQLIYCIAEGGYRVGWLSNWTTPEKSASVAANVFAENWEGHSGQTQRQQSAEYWVTEIASWEVDVTYANSIIEAAGNVSANATSGAVNSASKGCKKADHYDNSSMAMAAISYAYETKDEGISNDGTPLYRKVHDNVYPGDGYYQSCDRGVACAVRWSGSDDNYPAGACVQQLEYLITNTDKWTEVANWNGDFNNLEPGDILIIANHEGIHDHTVMFVGNELIGEVYPDKLGDPNFNNVSASFGERSPGCCYWYSDLGLYRVFRNIKTEANSKYTSAGD